MAGDMIDIIEMGVKGAVLACGGVTSSTFLYLAYKVWTADAADYEANRLRTRGFLGGAVPLYEGDPRVEPHPKKPGNYRLSVRALESSLEHKSLFPEERKIINSMQEREKRLVPQRVLSLVYNSQ